MSNWVSTAAFDRRRAHRRYHQPRVTGRHLDDSPIHTLVLRAVSHVPQPAWEVVRIEQRRDLSSALGCPRVAFHGDRARQRADRASCISPLRTTWLNWDHPRQLDHAHRTSGHRANAIAVGLAEPFATSNPSLNSGKAQSHPGLRAFRVVRSGVPPVGWSAAAVISRRRERSAAGSHCRTFRRRWR